MKAATRLRLLTALVLATFVSSLILAAAPATATRSRTTHRRSTHSRTHSRRTRTQSSRTTRRYSMPASPARRPRHGTSQTGAGQGTGTSMVPAGGTNPDPLQGGATGPGTATTGNGTSGR